MTMSKTKLIADLKWVFGRISCSVIEVNYWRDFEKDHSDDLELKKIVDDALYRNFEDNVNYNKKINDLIDEYVKSIQEDEND